MFSLKNSGPCTANIEKILHTLKYVKIKYMLYLPSQHFSFSFHSLLCRPSLRTTNRFILALELVPWVLQIITCKNTPVEIHSVAAIRKLPFYKASKQIRTRKLNFSITLMFWVVLDRNCHQNTKLFQLNINILHGITT